MKREDFNFHQHGFVGHLAEPYAGSDRAVIVIMGGEQSLLPGIKFAERFADYGITGLAVSLFGAEGLPDAPNQIPLDMFLPAVSYLREQKHIKHISVYGQSMGSIFSILVAQYVGGMENLILVSPTHVPFEGTLKDKKTMTGHSVATWHGEDIPFVRADFSAVKAAKYQRHPAAAHKVTGMWAAYYNAYQDKASVEKAKLAVERTDARVLLIAGQEDEAWPAELSVREIDCGAALLPNVAVCPFPAGTGNDFCRMFGTDAALFRDLDAVLDGEVRKIDLISCNGSYSANICSVGIDARIGIEVHRYSSLPLIGGAGGYVISAAVNAIKGIATGMHVRCGDYDSHEKYSLICACNGRFYGGGFNPSPTAMLDDGLLDIFIVKKVSLFTFARCVGKYASGHADDFPQFITHLRDTELFIEFDREDVINLDGEGLRAKSVSMKLLPKALNLIVPKGLGHGTELPPLTL